MFRPKYSCWSPYNNPDIVCHFSPGGVLASHINREFFWLERAYTAMRSGYIPDRFGYITAFKLTSAKGTRYVVLDGNHRISALHSIGKSRVLVNVIRTVPMSEILLPVWPGVLSRNFSIQDSSSILSRYFYDDNLTLPEDARQEILYDEALLIDKSSYEERMP